MNAQTETKPSTENLTGLELMRAPFPASAISKLPKPTKAQTEAVRNDFKQGIRCEVCGGWHHPKVVHLDYVGHAALTDRLLSCDPMWNWEPVAFDEKGAPARDANGGLWIRLTVCGVTRLGYGHADGKSGGDAIKELIGDALRNAAMRFGAALDLWHKGDLHAENDPGPNTPEVDEVSALKRAIKDAKKAIATEKTLSSLAALWGSFEKEVQKDATVIAAKDARKAALTPTDPAMQSPDNSDLGGDEIPY